MVLPAMQFSVSLERNAYWVSLYREPFRNPALKQEKKCFKTDTEDELEWGIGMKFMHSDRGIHIC